MYDCYMASPAYICLPDLDPDYVYEISCVFLAI